MGKDHGTETGIHTRRVGDDVGGEYRKQLLIEPHRQSGMVKCMNRIVALFLLYLLGHVIYALWEEL